jgi:hypothetical protein
MIVPFTLLHFTISNQMTLDYVRIYESFEFSINVNIIMMDIVLEHLICNLRLVWENVGKINKSIQSNQAVGSIYNSSTHIQLHNVILESIKMSLILYFFFKWFHLPIILSYGIISFINCHI